MTAETIVVHGGTLWFSLSLPAFIRSSTNTRIGFVGRMVPIEAGMVREEAHNFQLLGAWVTDVECRRAQEEQRHEPCQRSVHQEASIGHPTTLSTSLRRNGTGQQRYGFRRRTSPRASDPKSGSEEVGDGMIATGANPEDAGDKAFNPRFAGSTGAVHPRLPNLSC